MKSPTSAEIVDPTMDAPASGLVVTIVNGRELPLSYAEYWFSKGIFVVRSREFDCFTEGPTLKDALLAFGYAVYDYAEDLQELDDTGGITEDERETLKLLSDRLSRIYLEKRRRSQIRRRSWWLRPRRADRTEHRAWRSTAPA